MRGRAALALASHRTNSSNRRIIALRQVAVGCSGRGIRPLRLYRTSVNHENVKLRPRTSLRIQIAVAPGASRRKASCGTTNRLDHGYAPFCKIAAAMCRVAFPFTVSAFMLWIR
jgi:hypothetical protein